MKPIEFQQSTPNQIQISEMKNIPITVQFTPIPQINNKMETQAQLNQITEQTTQMTITPKHAYPVSQQQIIPQLPILIIPQTAAWDQQNPTTPQLRDRVIQGYRFLGNYRIEQDKERNDIYDITSDSDISDTETIQLTKHEREWEQDTFRYKEQNLRKELPDITKLFPRVEARRLEIRDAFKTNKTIRQRPTKIDTHKTEKQKEKTIRTHQQNINDFLKLVKEREKKCTNPNAQMTDYNPLTNESNKTTEIIQEHRDDWGDQQHEDYMDKRWERKIAGKIQKQQAHKNKQRQVGINIINEKLHNIIETQKRQQQKK